MQTKIKGNPRRRNIFWLGIGLGIGCIAAMLFFFALFDFGRDMVFEPIAQIPHDDYLNFATYNSDESRIFSYSADGTFKILDIEGNLISSFRDYGVNFWDMRWNNHQSQFLTIRQFTAALIFNTDGEIVTSLEHPGIHSAQWSPDNARILSFGVDRSHLWRSDGTLLESFPNTYGSNEGFLWSPDSSRFVLWQVDGSAIIYSVDGEEIAKLSGDGAVIQSAWNVDGSRLAMITYVPNMENLEFSLMLYSNEGEVIYAQEFQNDYPSIIWSPDGEHLGIRRYHEQEIFSLYNSDGEQIFEAPIGNVAVWNEDGSRLITSSEDGSDLLLRDAEANVLNTLAHEGDVRYTAPIWSPDGQYLASWTSKPETGEFNLFMWDVEGNLLHEMTQSTSIERLLWSPDSRTIISSGGFVARLWSIDGDEIAVLRHAQPIAGLRFSANGERILSIAQYGGSSSIENAVWTKRGEHITTVYTGLSFYNNITAWRSDFGQVLLQNGNRLEILNLQAGTIWFDFRLDD